MGLLARCEQRIERFVDGLTARLFPGQVSVAMVTRAVEDAVAQLPDGRGRTRVSNAFMVRVHPQQLAGLEARHAEIVEASRRAVAAVAANRGWERPRGVSVTLVGDEALV